MRSGDGRRTTAGTFLLAGAAALALSSCSTVGGDQQAGAPQQESVATKLLLGNANPPPITPPVDDAIKRDCPPIEILDGTAAFRAYDPPSATDPFSVRYQANLVDTARQCSSLGVEAAIRVGVTGRLILGPKGAPGAFRLPLRVAVVDEADKPVYSQVHVIDVVVPAGQTQAQFPHLEQDIVVPIPENRFRGWRILVGYDPKGVPAGAGRRSARR